jgi:hypothetical protein
VLLVNDLLDQLRVAVDEANTSDISDAELLQALNRGQTKLVRLATRKFAPMFRRETNITTTAGSREIELPDLAFGLVVNEVDVIKSGQAYRVDPASLSQLTGYDGSGTTDVPLYYAQQGNKLKLYPTPSGGVIVRVRYQVRPPQLVKQQGRVTTIVSGSNYVEVDALGSSLTTSIAALGAFVNWVDGLTGLVRATLQVSAIDTTNRRVTFKSASLDRSTVFGQTVSTSLPTDGAQDDYLCLASGTCIPTLIQDYADYLVQFACVEIKRKQGEDVTADFAALKDIEDDVRAMWAGRQTVRRVRRASAIWGGQSTSLTSRR